MLERNASQVEAMVANELGDGAIVGRKIFEANGAAFNHGFFFARPSVQTALRFAQKMDQVSPHFSVEQRELRALLKQVLIVLPHMSREACETAIAALLPLAVEAIQLSTEQPPAGLEEKSGMELVGLLMERRGERGVRAPPTEDGDDDDDAPIKPARKQPRFQSSASASGEAEAEEPFYADWDASVYNNLASVDRLGRRDGPNGPYGLFIRARANVRGGRRGPQPFFATAPGLWSIDKISEPKKRKRVSNVLIAGVKQLLRENGGQLHPELHALLVACKWGKKVLE